MSQLDDALAALQRAVSRLEAAAEIAVEPAAEQQRNAEIAQELSSRVDAALARLDKLLAEGG